MNRQRRSQLVWGAAWLITRNFLCSERASATVGLELDMVRPRASIQIHPCSQPNRRSRDAADPSPYQLHLAGSTISRPGRTRRSMSATQVLNSMPPARCHRRVLTRFCAYPAAPPTRLSRVSSSPDRTV